MTSVLTNSKTADSWSTHLLRYDYITESTAALIWFLFAKYWLMMNFTNCQRTERTSLVEAMSSTLMFTQLFTVGTVARCYLCLVAERNWRSMTQFCHLATRIRRQRLADVSYLAIAKTSRSIDIRKTSWNSTKNRCLLCWRNVSFLWNFILFVLF